MSTNKMQFLKDNDFNDSIEKSFRMIFKKMKITETRLNKDFKEFNYNELLMFLPDIKSTSYQSINLKWSLAKKYLDFYGNLEGQKITQEDLKKHISDPFAKYITRKELMEGLENLTNPQDKAILILLFEGVMGKGYVDLVTLKTSDIDFVEHTITIGSRIIDVSSETLKILEDTKNQTIYEKLGKCESGDVKYELNMASKYLIKSKPSKRNEQGEGYIKEAGIKARLEKIIVAIGKPNVTGLSIFHSGLIEKLRILEEGCGRQLGHSDVVYYLEKLGVEKFEPNGFVRALKYFNEGQK